MIKGFVKLQRYRHSSCLDIDILVMRVKYAGPNYTKLDVQYINRNYDNGNFIIDSEKNIKMLKEDYNKWYLVK